MKDLRKKESEVILQRQMFLQVLDILFEQGLIREDEKNRMRVMFTQLPERIGGYCGKGSDL